jgi:hypothetical protein
MRKKHSILKLSRQINVLKFSRAISLVSGGKIDPDDGERGDP